MSVLMKRRLSSKRYSGNLKESANFAENNASLQNIRMVLMKYNTNVHSHRVNGTVVTLAVAQSYSSVIIGTGH